MTFVSHNIFSKIISYLDLEEISEILSFIKISNHDYNELILGIGFNYKINHKIIKARLNNYQRRCGRCNLILKNDWAIILGDQDCGECLSSKKFNLELCNRCLDKPISRGDFTYKNCYSCQQVILLFGINILS